MERIKSKINEKLKLLYEAFNKESTLSIADIMNILSCNRTSAYNYLARFEESGYKLIKTTEKKMAYYSIKKCADDHDTELTYIPLTGKIMFKHEIINRLQQGSATAKELAQIGITTSYLYKLLGEMVHDKDIIKDASSYFLNTKKHPTTLSLSENDIIKTGTQLSNIAKSNPYYVQLKSIGDKINLTLGNIVQGDNTLDNYIIYGHKQFHFKHIADTLTRLDSYDYATHLLQIEYRTKSCEIISVTFSTGMIVYSLEKDSVYLMGKCNNDNIIIRYDSITHISETDEINRHFNSDEFKELYDTMFSISVDKPVKVVVEFENIFNIRKKLEQLCAQRQSAGKLQFINHKKSNTTDTHERVDKIVYTDTISGLSDFAAYLRRFGRAATVIEPQELKAMIDFSVNRTLERYLQEDIIDE